MYSKSGDGQRALTQNFKKGTVKPNVVMMISFCTCLHFLQMFCTQCGNQISQGHCFCAVCGSKCPFVETERKDVPTFEEFIKERNSDFDALTQVKAAERKDRFIPKRKKKPAADLVKVSE